MTWRCDCAVGDGDGSALVHDPGCASQERGRLARTAIVPLTVCLVGCGKTKLDRPAPAQELYTGNLFRAARAWAEECDCWFVVSGLHGLVQPERVIAPYENKLEPRTADAWGRSVVQALGHEMGGCGVIDVVILAGEEYAHPILLALHDTPTSWHPGIARATAPLRGMGIGKRLQWLRRAA